eukprot:TRINITY_DN3097_c0_g1_i3.p1 TRINITY_DN3097_c0_g1~~TRINITY_DN3097_c0_g1_i3.p1  ORF type:complete len:112 (-),score=38.07 TRINITY_DN3097_c0_g1_i3:39-374(-)
MIRRPPRSTLSSSSAASDVYKRQGINAEYGSRTYTLKRKSDNFATFLIDPPPLDLSLIHISEPTRLLSISYAVFCLKKKKKKSNTINDRVIHDVFIVHMDRIMTQEHVLDV